MITLYQFQFSHFCEKARWALDFKRLPYACKNLVPGPHLNVAKKLAPKTCLPILVHDGTVVQDSTSIITFLDEKHPDRPLTPRDGAMAKEALDWEEYLDEEIGVTLRLWFYHHTLPDRKRARRFLLEGAPWYGRPLMALIYPAVRDAMRKAMNINADSAKRSEARLLAALDRLDGALQERRFLVGDSFSRADLTACALLSPYCASGRSDAELEVAFPPEACELRSRHVTRPFFGWVRDTYKNHRQPEYTSA
jgi:glutathione S-transferase